MSLAQAKAEFDKIAAMAAADGIELRQENTHHTNIFNAHRLMKLGLSRGDRALAEKLNELLFAVFFVDNLNLADKQVLVEIGKKAGPTEAEIVAMLDSDQFSADEQEAARRVVRGVPYFIFENGDAASGAMPAEEFVAILKNAAAGEASAGTCGPDGCEIR